MVTVLFLAANPSDTVRLLLDHEIREIASSIRQSPHRASFSIHSSFAVRASEVAALLLRHQPDIVQFSGHGTPSGEIILEDDTGRSYPISSDALAAVLSFMKGVTKCVIINSNYSDTIAKALSTQIDHVIGIHGTISDESAILFAGGFYRALGHGRSIKEAYELGCINIELSGSDEHQAPKLYSSGSSDLALAIADSGQETPPPIPKDYLGTILNDRQTLGVFVGINGYDDPFIPNLTVCVDDVSAVYRALKTSQARLLCSGRDTNDAPTRNNVISELCVASRAAEENDLLVFYYSGHGFAEGNEGYLLTTDTRFAALKYTAVSMRDVSELMKDSEARAKVVILDACHSGAALGKDTLSVASEFIRHVFEEAEGIVTLASCKQGERSYEWPGKNRSVFTYFLLEAIGGKADVDRKGFVTVSDAHRYVTDSVRKWTKTNGLVQTPTLQAEVVGDIVLIRSY